MTVRNDKSGNYEQVFDVENRPPALSRSSSPNALWPGTPPRHFRQPRTYLDTFTYNYHGRINSQSRVIDGR